MNSSKTFGSIVSVTISNIVSIISGIVVGFVVPKLLSVEGYGFYKTFTLYATYISLFHLGIIDGIVLRHGGKDYDRMDRFHFRGVFRWYIIVNLFFAIVLSMCAILVREANTSFIVAFLGLQIIGVNTIMYFQQISQITRRFREYSFRKIIQGVLSILVVICFYLVMRFSSVKIDYRLYVALVVLVNYILAIWYIYTYRDIVIGKGETLRNSKSEVIGYSREGIPLLVANMCSTLILTLDRQFVNWFFDISTYAVYSFAYNMLSLVTVATSAISTVLYPTMKRNAKEVLVRKFDLLVSVILVFVFFALVAYFPLFYFINWFLPKYSGSMQIFRIIFAALPISSVITVVIHNYYKVFDMNAKYFAKSIVILAFSALANAVAYLWFGTTYSISVASIITTVLWLLYTEHIFVKCYQVPYKKNLLYAFLLMAIFYTITWQYNDYIGLVLYMVCFAGLTVIFYRGNFKEMTGLIKK